VVRTEHASLTYLKNFADNNTQLMRWSETELDFTVQHRAGTKIAHVNALSRHVGTMISKGNLNQKLYFANKQRINSVRK